MKGKKVIFAAFTKKGAALALKTARIFNARVFAPKRFLEIYNDGLEAIDGSLNEWTRRYFNEVEAIIFVGACGIAVRAISSHVKNKVCDPAVIVIDEAGKFVIPILSGHIGGANELARKIAALLNAQAVITTATDVNNIVAVDEWAIKNNCMIENPEVIKKISGVALEVEHHSVGVAVTDTLQSAPWPVTLWLRPKVLVLGAGCKKGVASDEFEKAAVNFLENAGASPLSLTALASVDIKANEPALLKFAERHEIQLLTFRPEELMAVQGNYFASSERVLKATGADNVCERAAMLGAGNGAVLLRSKFIVNGMTFALARKAASVAS